MPRDFPIEKEMVQCCEFSDFVIVCLEERKTVDRDDVFFVSVITNGGIVADGEPHGTFKALIVDGKVNHQSILEAFFPNAMSRQPSVNT